MFFSLIVVRISTRPVKIIDRLLTALKDPMALLLHVISGYQQTINVKHFGDVSHNFVFKITIDFCKVRAARWTITFSLGHVYVVKVWEIIGVSVDILRGGGQTYHRQLLGFHKLCQKLWKNREIITNTVWHVTKRNGHMPLKKWEL